MVGVILCKQSISTFQYFKFVIGVIKRENRHCSFPHFEVILLHHSCEFCFPDLDYFNPSYEIFSFLQQT